VRKFLLLLVFIAACGRREAQHSNVLLITLDTFRADRIGAATPNLQKLAREGLWFRQAESAVPLTLPAHATILSGLLPPHHGVRNNGAGAFPANRETLATTLSRAGYRTGAFVSAFVLDRRFGLSRGFDVYDDAVERDPNDTAATFEAERRGGETVNGALAWIKRNDPRPWFAWVHLYDAHAPYAPPPPHPQTYDGEIAYVDEQVGRLSSAVDRRNTVIVVVGDHGEALGAHGELTHGLLLYEPTLHVPMVIAAPALRAREVREPVSISAIAPTIAALAGVSMPPSDGRDVSHGAASDTIYAETEYPATFGWSPLRAMRVGDTKLIRGVTSELFDLRRDPAESSNILNDHRRTYNEFVAKLDSISKTAITSSGVVDEETRSKLASLGYVAPRAAAGAAAADPRVMAPLFRRFEEATWAINSGRFREAIASLEKLIREDPANSVFRSTLARACRQAGNIDRAIALYREAVALSPADPDAWYNLATALQESGRSAEARKVAAEAERLDPNRPDLHNVNGVARIESGDPAGAEGEFRKAIELDPRSARAYNNLGNVLRILGRTHDAESAYRKALEIAPRYADPLNGLGVLAVQEGRLREAIKYLDHALQIAPDFYEAQLNRAIALQIAGDRSAAKAELRGLLARLPAGRRYQPQRTAAKALLARLP
jgi:arylsulfatase A-like enzyme/Flp pilus assembly protein TadD